MERVTEWRWQAAATAVITMCLALPLIAILEYPTRVSVLSSLQADAAAYDQMARSLARTGRLDALDPLHPPGFIAQLALVYRLAGGSLVAGKLLLLAALGVTVFLAGRLAARVYGRDAGWFAAILVASSPALAAYTTTLQYEVVTACWLLSSIVLGVAASVASTARARLGWSSAAGVAAGILVVTRETFALAAFALLIWLWTEVRRVRGTRAAYAAAMLFAVSALLLPGAWSARQSLAHGRLIVISEKGPINLKLGHNPRANGTYNASLAGMAEPSGLEFALSHPRREVELSLRKFLYFFGVLRDGWNVPRPGSVFAWRATGGTVPYEWVASAARGGWLLVLIGAALASLGWSGLARWWILPVIVLLILGAHIATISSHRFAVPILPVVFVMGSGVIARVAVWLSSRRQWQLGAGGAIIAASMMQAGSWPLELQHRAADLDGLDAENREDAVSGELVRFASAAGGVRPVLLLSDEYLPGGDLRLEVRARRGPVSDERVPVARVGLVHVDGTPACLEDVPADRFPPDGFASVAFNCRISADGPVTLLAYSLGTADLALASVRLSWR